MLPKIGFSVLHDNMYIHGDMKEGNLMVVEKTNPETKEKLLNTILFDFGFSIDLSSDYSFITHFQGVFFI